MPVVLEKYMNFNMNFHFISSLLDSLAENLGKKDLEYLSQEFDTFVLDLVEQKVLYLYECMSDFKKFKEKLPSKEKFYSSLTNKKLVIMDMNMFLKFGIYFK